MDQVAALYNLQEIDTEILALKHSVTALPHAKEIAELKEHLTKRTQQTKRALQQRSQLTRQIEEQEDEVRAAQRRISEIKQICTTSNDHRFLMEAHDEISLLEKRIDKLEFTAKPLKEKQAQYTQIIEASARNIKREHERYTELIAKDEATKHELEQKIAELSEERAEEAARLDDETLDRYESSREKHNGIGLARLTDEGSCSACKISFPEGIIYRLRRGTIFTECPNCHRFMIVEEALDD